MSQYQPLVASTITSGSGPAARTSATMPSRSELSRRTIEWVVPVSSRRTMSERRRCRSMPTYCFSTGVLLRRGWVGLETSSVSTLGPSRRSETPTSSGPHAIIGSTAGARRRPNDVRHARAALRSFITSEAVA